MLFSLNQTIFGGVLFIIAAYHTLRFLKVSHYWCGVISTTLALIGYGIYAFLHTPSFDVVSIHVAIYAATAVVAAMIDARKVPQNPQTGKMHWVPKAVALFFIVIFAVNAFFVTAATNGISDKMVGWFLPTPSNQSEHGKIHTGFSGVVNHNEDAADTINQHLSHQDKQARLGWNVRYTGLEHVVAQHPEEIILMVENKTNLPLEKAQVQFSYKRPGQTQPHQVISLKPFAPGQYRETITFPEKGLWLTHIDVKWGTDLYNLDGEITAQ